MVDCICVECKNPFDANPPRGFNNRSDFTCKACKVMENTQGLINKDLLLEPSIEDLQAKHQQAMLKFRNKL